MRACSVRQHNCFFPPNRCCAHLLGIEAVASKVAHHHGHVASPPQAHEFSVRPAGPALQRFAHIYRDSASLRYCATVQHRSSSCPCFTLLQHACYCSALRLASVLGQLRSCSRRFTALRTPPTGRPPSRFRVSDEADRRSVSVTVDSGQNSGTSLNNWLMASA